MRWLRNECEMTMRRLWNACKINLVISVKGLWDYNRLILKTVCLRTKDCDIAKWWLWVDYEIIEIYMGDDCENNLRWLYDDIFSQYETLW